MARREFWTEIHDLAAEGLTVLVSTHYMDEAERCHEIAYIAYGTLLAHGTVQEVIAQAGLTTVTITGPRLHELQSRLAGRPGIELVAPFGASLHVGGRDAAALEASLRTLADGGEFAGLRIEPAEPSLEDVFIDLMSRATDNFT